MRANRVNSAALTSKSAQRHWIMGDLDFEFSWNRSLCLFAMWICMSTQALADSESRLIPVTNEFFVSETGGGAGGSESSLSALPNGDFLLTYWREASPAIGDPTQSHIEGVWAVQWDDQGRKTTNPVRIGGRGLRGTQPIIDDAGLILLKKFGNRFSLLGPNYAELRSLDLADVYYFSTRHDRSPNGNTIVFGLNGFFQVQVDRFDPNLDSVGEPTTIALDSGQSGRPRVYAAAVNNNGNIALLARSDTDTLFLFYLDWQGQVRLERELTGSESFFPQSVSHLESGLVQVVGVLETEVETSVLVKWFDSEADLVAESVQALAPETNLYRPRNGDTSLLPIRTVTPSGRGCSLLALEGSQFGRQLDPQINSLTGCFFATNGRGRIFLSWLDVLDRRPHVRGQIFEIAEVAPPSEPVISIHSPSVCVEDLNSVVEVTSQPEFDIRVQSPAGRVFKQAGVESARTGLWARQGLIFYATDPLDGQLVDWKKVNLSPLLDDCPDSGMSLDPSPLDFSPARVTLDWSYSQIGQARVQIRVNSPTGPTLGTGGTSGTITTGPWVRHQTRFFATSGDTVLGAITARVECGWRWWCELD